MMLLDVASLFGDLMPVMGLVVLAGAGAGFAAGLLGIGGGSVLVPVLYALFGALHVDESVRMHMALGTSFAIMIPTSFRSFQTHLNRGAVDVTRLKIWAPMIVCGVVLGWGVAALLSARALQLIFACGAVVIALNMLFKRNLSGVSVTHVHRVVDRVVALMIGLISHLMGIGGGVFSTSYFRLCGMDIKRAIATSSGVGVAISFPGMIGYLVLGVFFAAGKLSFLSAPVFSVGYISLLGVALMLPLSVVFAPLGARVAHALPPRLLNVLFVSYLIFIAFKFVAEALS